MLQRLAELGRDGGFLAEGEDGLQAFQALAGIADGLGEAVLGQGRQPAQPPRVEEQGGEPDGQQHQHHAGEAGAERRQQQDGAGEGQRAAQGDGDGGSDHPLDDGHVGGHARQQLAGLELQHLRDVQHQGVLVDRLAHVDDDAFAQLVDEIDAQGGRHGEHRGHGGGQQEAAFEGGGGVQLEAVVHQPTGRAGEAERREAGQHHEECAEQGVPPVRAHVGEQAAQGPEVAAGTAFAGGGLEGLFQQMAGAGTAGRGRSARDRADHERVRPIRGRAGRPVTRVSQPMSAPQWPQAQAFH